MSKLNSIDPGKEKCGLLLVDIEEEIVLDGKVVYQFAVIDLITDWIAQGDLNGMLLGNGTTSAYWKKKFDAISQVELVEERGTTLRARTRFWELWPPGFFLSLVPKGLLIPPNPLDAVAALILLENHLERKFSWEGNPNFKIVP